MIKYITKEQFENLTNWANQKGYSDLKEFWYGVELWYSRNCKDVLPGTANKLGGVSNDGKYWCMATHHKIALKVS